MKILGLCGEYGPKTKSGMLVQLALEYAEQQGAEVTFWDATQTPLPLVGEEGCWNHPHVKMFQELLLECDGFLVASPEYHGSLSGVMKNTFDWMYDKHVGGKVFGLMSTLGGMSNSNTINHMRIIVRWLHGWSVPEQIAIGHVKDAFNEEGQLNDESLNERLHDVVNSVMNTIEKFSS